jgi:hypothetical protein
LIQPIGCWSDAAPPVSGANHRSLEEAARLEERRARAI